MDLTWMNLPGMELYLDGPHTWMELNTWMERRCEVCISSCLCSCATHHKRHTWQKLSAMEIHMKKRVKV